MRAKNRKYKFLYILLLLKRHQLVVCLTQYQSTFRACTCWRGRYSIFSRSQQSIQNIVYWLWIFSLLKRTFTRWKVEIFWQENWNISIEIFNQNEIKKLNQNYNIEMFRSRVRRGRAHAAEQKLENSKNFFFPKQTTA